jgi:uncharacterized protein
VVDLDEPATRAAVLADPSAFVDGPSPVCIDEYQHVPAVLDAIKAELNREPRPNRYVITGSTATTRCRRPREQLRDLRIARIS